MQSPRAVIKSVDRPQVKSACFPPVVPPGAASSSSVLLGGLSSTREKGTPVEPLQPTDPTTIGRYRVTGRLGAGGMGNVFVGLSPGGRPAAVKVIHESFQGNAEALARFRREVETLRTVRSAYTAALIDSQTEVAPYWLATEYVPGPTLHSAVEDTGPFAADACYGMLAALAEGLADIHGHGICHRDLKPRNVILAATGPQLIDFGIARGDGQEGITRAGYAVGTPGYTAPETLADDPVTPAADVFALGATIAFAATGRPPYGGGTVTTVSLRAMSGRIDLDGIDPGLAQLLRACAAVDPAQRPAPKAIIEACDRRATSPVVSRTPAGTGAGTGAGHTSVLPAELAPGPRRLAPARCRGTRAQAHPRRDISAPAWPRCPVRARTITVLAGSSGVATSRSRRTRFSAGIRRP
ncbi:MAG: serine/threonine-protein kinase [Actinoplanes sp.]